MRRICYRAPTAYLNPTFKAWARLLFLVIFTSYLHAEAENDHKTFRMRPPQQAPSLEELQKSLETAPPETFFSVWMTLDLPSHYSELQEIAQYLQIPRVLAFVEYRQSPRPAEFPLALGTLYTSKPAQQRELCQASVIAVQGLTQRLENIAPDQWPVKKIHVYGTAFAIQELRNGTLLPVARLTSGARSGAQDFEFFANEAQRKLASKIETPIGASIPEGCQPYIQPMQTAVLTRNGHSEAGSNLQQALANMTPETPVTLNLTFNVKADIETLVALVADYQIDGLSAEISLKDRNQKVLLPIELSIHTLSSTDWAKRAKCRIQLGGHDKPDSWYTHRAQVTIPTSKAWLLLSYQHLESAALEGKFAPREIERLKYYYQSKVGAMIRIPRTIALPKGCETFITHDS